LTFTTGLTPATEYFFVVRARDEFGNTDTNSVEVSGSTVADSLPPSFAGATGVGAATTSSLTVTRSPATDNVTPQAAIVYDVCVSASPTACATSFVTTLTTAAGATSATRTGLAPSTTYYFVVRARDTAGNRDTNTVARSGATTPDTTPPTFAGASAVTGASLTSLTVNWNPATDDVTSQGAIVYEICISAVSTGCSVFSVSATTAPGASSYLAAGLVPGTTYYFRVRARDAAGNRDSNVVVRSGVTLADTTPPTGGLANGASRSGCGSRTLSWTGATDNYTTTANILYRVCWSTTSGGCTTSWTTNATATGATSYSFSGLTASRYYYFVVRAEDQFGNRSSNTTQVALDLSDGVGPSWGAGSTTVVANRGTPASGSVTLDFPDATDSCSGAQGIRYRVCHAVAAGDCTTTWFNDYTTPFNQSVATIAANLPTNSMRSFYIRAEDAYGNQGPTQGPFVGTTKLSFASYRIVTPDNLGASTMYQKVMNTGATGVVMPPSPYSTTATFKTNLATWINQGACNN
jgi:hypothetical protein